MLVLMQVFQRRTDGSVDFYRTWAAYKIGFGLATGEYWLGNDNIHSLSTNQTLRLRIDMLTFGGASTFAEYEGFSMDDESTNYTLRYESYLASSTASEYGHM